MDRREFFKLMSVLLHYPDETVRALDWQAVAAELDNSEWAEALDAFGSYFRQTPLETLQENYVRTFDFNDQTTLYLTYSKLGDEKERGQALAELKQIYSDAGLTLSSTELPDYLPLVLEFVSQADAEIGIDLLRRFREPIARTQQALAAGESPYALLLEGLLIEIDRTLSEGVL
ncbi:MAG: nitrate reductase molybdenum cofactor assembly chaperone [Calditrichaeota bacterium]|nr:nitrate reductase molybdenum cofactor assembly chaperone [Calditrichota bacterium]